MALGGPLGSAQVCTQVPSVVVSVTGTLAAVADFTKPVIFRIPSSLLAPDGSLKGVASAVAFELVKLSSSKVAG